MFFAVSGTARKPEQAAQFLFDAHFCVDNCVKVPKIRPHFLTHRLPLAVLTYNAVLVMINTDAQAVAQSAENIKYDKKMEKNYAGLYQRNGHFIVG
ncbi:MAG: hypothetical protein K2I96_25580 [Lachnospiraceae bacterium]|nr:hypothetical protein [Lachnospiraceae bacterium]